jgi:hypothetical protein
MIQENIQDRIESVLVASLFALWQVCDSGQTLVDSEQRGVGWLSGSLGHMGLMGLGGGAWRDMKPSQATEFATTGAGRLAEKGKGSGLPRSPRISISVSG